MAESAEFEWKPEYDAVLAQIASNDIVETEWTRLRGMIKHKLEQNIAAFLGDDAPKIPPSVISSPKPGPNGGLKLPPFPHRSPNPSNPNAPQPKINLTQAEADEFKGFIFGQLDEFEQAPFTIQRVCELCVNPQQHYKFLGKYLRAVERSLLVTSTWDTFPPLSVSERTYAASGHPSLTTSAVSAPNTPIFSPIPFLHEDARRSKSRSPPPSPLALPAMMTGQVPTTGPHAAEESAAPKALGLVDELDDPSPGHLSDHIEPISSTTTIGVRPALEDRFVRAETEGGTEPQPQAEDDDEGKENRAV